MAQYNSQKSVKFAAGTIFGPKARKREVYLRSHSLYSPGAHSCPDDNGWEDTSLEAHTKYHVDYLRVHSVITINGAAHLSALRETFNAEMKSCAKILSENCMILKNHLFREQVFEMIQTKLSKLGYKEIQTFRDDLRQSDGLVMYRTRNGELAHVQILVDTYQDHQAYQWVEELRKEIPVVNIGRHRSAVLASKRSLSLASSILPSIRRYGSVASLSGLAP